MRCLPMFLSHRLLQKEHIKGQPLFTVTTRGCRSFLFHTSSIGRQRPNRARGSAECLQCDRRIVRIKQAGPRPRDSERLWAFQIPIAALGVPNMPGPQGRCRGRSPQRSGPDQAIGRKPCVCAVQGQDVRLDRTARPSASIPRR